MNNGVQQGIQQAQNQNSQGSQPVVSGSNATDTNSAEGKSTITIKDQTYQFNSEMFTIVMLSGIALLCIIIAFGVISINSKLKAGRDQK